MPLAGTGDALGTKIAAAVSAITVDQTTPVPASKLEEIWQAAAKEIVAHIVANAFVQGTGLDPGGLAPVVVPVTGSIL